MLYILVYTKKMLFGDKIY